MRSAATRRPTRPPPRPRGEPSPGCVNAPPGSFAVWPSGSPASAMKARAAPCSPGAEQGRPRVLAGAPVRLQRVEPDRGALPPGTGGPAAGGGALEPKAAVHEVVVEEGVAVDHAQRARAPGDRLLEAREDRGEGRAMERVEEIDDGDVVGNRVVQRVAVDELDRAATSPQAAARHVAAGGQREVLGDLAPDPPLEAILRGLQHEPALARPEIQEDVHRRDLAGTQH